MKTSEERKYSIDHFLRLIIYSLALLSCIGCFVGYSVITMSVGFMYVILVAIYILNGEKYTQKERRSIIQLAYIGITLFLVALIVRLIVEGS